MQYISDLGRKLKNLFFGGFSRFLSYTVGFKGEVWVDTQTPRDLYYSIPQLPMVLDRLGDMVANAEIKIFKDGKPVEKHPALSLICTPNFYQTQNEFYKQLTIQFMLYGSAYEFWNGTPLGLISRHLISPYYMRPQLTGKLYKQTTLKDCISKYEYIDQNSVRETYETDSILHFVNADVDNPLVGISKIVTLKYPLSNIKGAYAYENTILTNKGPITLISSAAKDGTGGIPIGPEQKKEIESQFTTEYGTGEGQRSVKITEANVDVKNLSYPVKDMLLQESKDSGLRDICHLYGVNTNIFFSQSTFANLSAGYAATYRDAVFPFADMVSQGETLKARQFGLIKENETIVFSYAHIDVLKNEKTQAKMGISQTITAVTNAVNSGLMQAEQGALLIAEILT